MLKCRGKRIDAVYRYIEEGKTIAFIGASGVGKSTLINRLMGREVLATKEIRESDDRGRHATRHTASCFYCLRAEWSSIRPDERTAPLRRKPPKSL